MLPLPRATGQDVCPTSTRHCAGKSNRCNKARRRNKRHIRILERKTKTGSILRRYNCVYGKCKNKNKKVIRTSEFSTAIRYRASIYKYQLYFYILATNTLKVKFKRKHLQQEKNPIKYLADSKNLYGKAKDLEGPKTILKKTELRNLQCLMSRFTIKLWQWCREGQTRQSPRALVGDTAATGEGQSATKGAGSAG